MKVGIIGRFADKKELLDGQTIKTRILRDELKKRLTESKIRFVDVYNYKLNCIIILIKIFCLFIKSDVIIVLLSQNGRKVLFPYMYFLNKIFNRKIYHDVIGGVFCESLESDKKLKKYVISFTENWVETNSMKNKLENRGIYNVDVVPNFKSFNPIKKEEVYSLNELKFCTFSRVTKAKGITDAIEMIAKINKSIGCNVILDVYGEIEDSYKEEFDNLIKKYKSFVSYKGKVHYNDSINIIKNYYMLVFPTTFEGEGFPGTIIDAFFAGVPVIATNWRYNSEILINGYTGIIYDYKEENRLYEAIEYCIKNKNEISNMRINCLKEAEKYSSDKIMEKIISKINK